MLPEPLITAKELRSRLSDAIVLDASWIYPPFNKAAIDVAERYGEAHIAGSWFLDLASLSKNAIADERIDALARPSPALLRALISRTRPAEHSLFVITDMDGGCTTAPFARYPRD
jgi:3-mercaptopyruvate sulfurtransferase SseA